MKIEELVRNHIDGAARPVTLEEVRQRADSQPTDGLQAIAILDPDIGTNGDPASSVNTSSLAALDSTSHLASPSASDKEADAAEAVEIKRGLHLGFWLQAAAVFVVIGLSAAAMLWFQDGRSTNIDTAATPEAQAAAALATAEAAVTATVEGWTQIDDPDNIFLAPDITELFDINSIERYKYPDMWGRTPSIFQVIDIEHLSSGYYAVGSHQDEMVMAGSIWHSEDTKSWERIFGSESVSDDWDFGSSFPSGTQVEAITDSGGTVIAVGTRSGKTRSATTWIQSDHGPWQAIGLPSQEDSWIYDFSIASTTEGFTITGTKFNTEWKKFEPAVWRSCDGLNWDVVNSPAFAEGDRIHDLVVLGETLIAVGSSGGWEGSAAAWSSKDGGMTWSRSVVPTGAVSLPLSGIYSVAVGPEGLLAIGGRSSSDGHWEYEPDSAAATLSGTVNLAIWTSPDGLVWTEQKGPTDSGGHENAMNVTWGPAGFLITSTTVWLNGYHGSSWLTVDGTELSRVGNRRDTNSSMLNLVATPEGYISLADPHFHVFDNDHEPHSTPDTEPHRLEIWKLEVAKADG